MNWLAHLLLSRRHIDYQLGNLLADPLRGRVWSGASELISQGMQMHISIDAFTDAHDVVSRSKARLGAGRLKGVVIDLLYDHYLARHWQDYASVSSSQFLHQFYCSAQAISSAYPERAQQIINGLIRSDRLASYHRFEGFIDSLHSIDRRLSPRARARESALDYLDLVKCEYDNLEEDFRQFFPELIHFFKHHPLGSPKDHYLLE